MKFLALTENILEKEVLNADLAAGHAIGRITLGQNILFVKKGLKTYYISYADIHRTFRRVKCVKANICCGKGQLELQYLVLADKKTEIAEIDLPDERSALAVIKELQNRAPQIKIGKKD